MDIPKAMAAAKTAYETVKALHGAEAVLDQPKLRGKLTDVMERLTDVREALLDAREQIAVKDAEIERLRRFA
jgi:hypothetical protein